MQPFPSEVIRAAQVLSRFGGAALDAAFRVRIYRTMRARHPKMPARVAWRLAKGGSK